MTMVKSFVVVVALTSALLMSSVCSAPPNQEELSRGETTRGLGEQGGAQGVPGCTKPNQGGLRRFGGFNQNQRDSQPEGSGQQRSGYNQLRRDNQQNRDGVEGFGVFNQNQRDSQLEGSGQQGSSYNQQRPGNQQQQQSGWSDDMDFSGQF